MATNTRPPTGNRFSAGITLNASHTYRTTPAPGGSTTSLPTNGAAAANDVWEECYGPGATTPSYLLVGTSGRTYDQTQKSTVDS